VKKEVADRLCSALGRTAIGFGRRDGFAPAEGGPATTAVETAGIQEILVACAGAGAEIANVSAAHGVGNAGLAKFMQELLQLNFAKGEGGTILVY
jgi:hypothetical protein